MRIAAALVEFTRLPGVVPAAVATVDAAQWTTLASAFAADGRLVALWGSDRHRAGEGIVVLCAYAADDGLALVRLPLADDALDYPDLSALFPAAGRMQRAMGLLSGLTGVGGGIFLSPLLVLAGWATVRDSAAPAAAFILINSIAGLVGLLTRHPTLPDALPYWVLAVIAGGLIGAGYGARRLDNRALRRALAAVLLIAGGKMLL